MEHKDEKDEPGSDIARRFMEEQARRAAEQKARAQEAERKRQAEEEVRREQERIAAEEREKRRREEDARKRAEEEEAERLKQEEQARRLVDLEARAREDAFKARQAAEMSAVRDVRAKEAAARMRREFAARTGATGTSYRRSSRTWRIVTVLVLLMAFGLYAVNFISLDTRSFEKAATAQFGVPVTIGAARLSTLTLPTLRFERVAIGPAGEVKIDSVDVKAGLRTFIDANKSFKTIELQGVKVPVSWLGALWGKAPGDALRVERVIARDVTVEGEGLDLPKINVDATLDAGASLRALRAETADRMQTLNIAMTGGVATVDLSAKPFRLPFAGAVQFDDFLATGTLTPTELNLSKFDARVFDGSFFGSARLRWGASWSLEGDFVARAMDPARVAATLVPTGKLEGQGTFSMRAAAPGKLQDTARLDAIFTVQRGTLGFVDLTRLLQGSNGRTGKTPFTRMEGNLSVSGGTVQLRQLRVAAGLLNATGDARVDTERNLSGRFQVGMASQAGAVVSLGGTVAAPQVRR